MSVIIFGCGDMAEMAYYYLTQQGRHVHAFCVDREYIKKDTLFGRPIVPFEDVVRVMPPAQYRFFAPLYATKLNTVRAAVAARIKAAGYQLINYVHPDAHLSDATIGENCFIHSGVEMQPFVKVGNNVFIGPNTVVAHHCVIEDNCFISGNVAIAGRTRVGAYSFIGTGADIMHGLQIAEGTVIGQSASLVKNTNPYSLYLGIPAKMIEGKDTRGIEL